MQKQFFCIYDTKVGVYRDPILATNEFDLIRDYERLCRNPEGEKDVLVSNAEDFQLFRVGSYSPQEGKITPQPPEHVANLFEIKSSVARSAKTQKALEAVQ